MIKKRPEKCLFCKLVQREIPFYPIYESPCTIAFLDISNDKLGHTLVIPKKHSDNFLDTVDGVLDACMVDVRTICRHYVNDLGFSGVKIFINNGKSAGQSIFHLHVHIVPTGKPEKIELPNPVTNLERIQQLFKV